MKKIIAITLMMVILLIQAPAFALDLSGNSANGDIVKALSDITVDQPATGNVVALSGDIVINSDVSGEVFALMGDITINASVMGNVTAVMGNIKLGPNAKVMGNLTGVLDKVEMQSGSEVLGNVVSIGSVEKADGVTLHGQNTEIDISQFRSGEAYGGYLLFLKVLMLIFFMITMLVLGIIVIAVFRKRFKVMANKVDEGLGKKFAIGMLAYLVITVISILFSWTVLIPLAYMLIMLFAEVITCVYIGRVCFRTLNVKTNTFFEFLLGLIVVGAIELLIILFTPVNGILITFGLTAGYTFLISSLGVGIIFDTKFGKADPLPNPAIMNNSVAQKEEPKPENKKKEENQPSEVVNIEEKEESGDFVTETENESESNEKPDDK